MMSISNPLSIRTTCTLLGMCLLAWLFGGLAGCKTAGSDRPSDHAETSDSGPSADTASEADGSASVGTVRIATFNASLSGDEAENMANRLADPDARQPRRVAEIVQRVRPDILLINEFDYTGETSTVERFQSNFLDRSQNGAEPIQYPHVLYPEVNTGVHSGYDLDDNGRVVSEAGSEIYANDAWGYGEFPGQYGMVLLSKHPIDEEAVRSFRTLQWHEMPDSEIPEGWYGPEARDAMRLSSKTHLDVPIRLGNETIHVLASHPTPPAFGGPKNRNERRNHDEVRFWRDYLTPDRAGYIVDDSGTSGGLPADEAFVLLGDLNADPNDGAERTTEAIGALLEHSRTTDPRPTSEGGRLASERQGGTNDEHTGDPALDTANFGDNTGNLRVDYALPSNRLEVDDAGVFWPAPDSSQSELVGVSDHRLVWVDVTVGR
jgi:alkaline phosphatase D